VALLSDFSAEIGEKYEYGRLRGCKMDLFAPTVSIDWHNAICEIRCANTV